MYEMFQQLAAGYDGFSAPAANVIVDGKSIMKSSAFAVEDLRVDLDIEKANVAEIRLASAQDESRAAFKAAVEKQMTLGSTVEVQLGYGSKLKSVFFGYIGRLDFAQSEDGGKGAELYAFDVRRLMMESVRDKVYEGAMKAAIIRQILSDYGKVCRSLVCDVSGSTDGNVTQNDTDYRFIMQYLLGSEVPKKYFYMVGDTAYINSPKASLLNCVTELEKGRGLYSFSNQGNYLDTKVEVQGYDPDKAQGFYASSSSRSEERQKNLTPLKKVLGSGGIHAEGEAKKIVQRIADEMQEAAVGGQAVCVGVPTLVPGKAVKLVVKDMGISDYFLIKGAEHEFGESGYVVTLRFGKDELSELLAGPEQPKGAEHDALPKSKEDGIMLGTVVDNWDDGSQGRKLLVELGIGEKGKTRTEWISYVSMYGGKDYGLCFRPEVGSQVAVGFLSGDKNTPIVLGVVREDRAALPEEARQKENEVKEIVTKAGHRIIFRETVNAAIEIQTAGGAKLLLDDENGTLSLMGKSGKNQVVIQEKENTIAVTAQQTLTLKAGNSTIELSDSEIRVQAGTIQVKASQQLKMNGAKTEVSGNDVGINGSGNLNLESSGVATVKGSLLKLN